MFERFYFKEYLFLHEGRLSDSSVTSDSAGAKEAMVRANMVDSDEFRMQRKQSYNKLCAMIELFS